MKTQAARTRTPTPAQVAATLEHEQQTCPVCARPDAVAQLMAVRDGKSCKALTAAVEQFGQCFELCSSHALERYDSAVSKIAPGGTEDDRVKAIVAELDVRDAVAMCDNRYHIGEDFLSDLADEKLKKQGLEWAGGDIDKNRAAWATWFHETYKPVLESKETWAEAREHAAWAIDKAEQSESKLAKIYGITPDRVRLLAAAARVQFFGTDHVDGNYEPTVPDILLERLKANNASVEVGEGDFTAEQEMQLAACEAVQCHDPSFAKFKTAVGNLNLSGAAKAQLRAQLEAPFVEAEEKYLSPTTREAEVARARESIAKRPNTFRNRTAEEVADGWMSYRTDPRPHHKTQRKQLETLMSGRCTPKIRKDLTLAVYGVVSDAIAQLPLAVVPS